MKEFFKKTIVRVLGWVFIALGTIVLFLGGTGTAEISKGIVLVVAIIEAIGVLITFVATMIGTVKKRE